MDQTAIEAIRDLAITRQANAILEDCDSLKSTLIVTPKDCALVDLEKYQLKPSRFRADFNTHIIKQFVDYVNENGSVNTGIFIDPKQSIARAIIDMGDNSTPGWGEHKASLSLEKSPEFLSVITVHGCALSQQDFIDFAEDWEGSIEFADNKNEPLDFKQSITALRKITVSSTQNNEQAIGNFNASQSSLDAIEVKAAGELQIPYGFNFTCVPYESFGSRTLSCQLRAVTDGKSVSLKYRITGLDRLINEIGNEFKEMLIKDLIRGDVYIGSIQYQK